MVKKLLIKKILVKNIGKKILIKKYINISYKYLYIYSIFIFIMNIEKLIKALDDESNEVLLNFTTEKIRLMNLNVLKE